MRRAKNTRSCSSHLRTVQERSGRTLRAPFSEANGNPIEKCVASGISEDQFGLSARDSCLAVGNAGGCILHSPGIVVASYRQGECAGQGLGQKWAAKLNPRRLPCLCRRRDMFDMVL